VTPDLIVHINSINVQTEKVLLFFRDKKISLKTRKFSDKPKGKKQKYLDLKIQKAN